MNLSNKKANAITLVVFLAFSVWWVGLHTFIGSSDNSLKWFSGTYGVMALVGAIIGIIYSRNWGSFKSYIGRAILMFSLGLLLQEFGQLAYTYLGWNTSIQNVPYPSVGDIGYFGSIFFYIYGVWLLGKVVGARVSLKSYGNKIQAILIPIVILVTSYLFFLRGYTFDWSHPITVLLDFGYPLGQAFYLSLAILVFLFSRKYLGGLMRPVIVFVLFALLVQYAADFMFLYQNQNGIWTTAGANDYIYLFSYFVMTMALIRFRTVYSRLGSKQSEKSSRGSTDAGE